MVVNVFLKEYKEVSNLVNNYIANYPIGGYNWKQTLRLVEKYLN
jgi:hypothetical protein